MNISDKALATRERILESADNLFYLHGYNATGLDKIIKAAEVTKGNFYYHFESKESLAIASLERHFDLLTKELEQKVLNRKKSPLKTLFGILDLMSGRQKKQKQDGYMRGCYFGNLTLELSTDSQAVRNKVKDIFKQYLDLFESLLKEAKNTGEVADDIDPKTFSAVILSQMEGAMLLDKANQKPLAMNTCVRFIKRYLSP
ncbi:MAG TPA: TetR/AcrR family transcriptional regulator [Chromatiales bacterium]|nr:TetR/AcrR family transcriptional regulator [Chromatiales bacterium]